MTTIHKYLLYLLSLLASSISYIPATIYQYVYSEFFTKYTPSYPELPTDKSVLEIKTKRASKMSSISALQLEALYRQSSDISKRPGFWESITINTMYQPVRNFLRKIRMWKSNIWTSTTCKKNNPKLSSTSLSSAPVSWFSPIKPKPSRLPEVSIS